MKKPCAHNSNLCIKTASFFVFEYSGIIVFFILAGTINKTRYRYVTVSKEVEEEEGKHEGRVLQGGGEKHATASQAKSPPYFVCMPSLSGYA